MYRVCSVIVGIFVILIFCIIIKGRNKKYTAPNLKRVPGKSKLHHDVMLSKEIDKIKFKDIIKR